MSSARRRPFPSVPACQERDGLLCHASFNPPGQHLPDRRRPLYRVWITRCDAWSPRSWNDMPPRMVAVEPAESAAMTSAEAAIYVAAYNRAMIALRRRRWAVAIPVWLRFEGDLVPGQRLTAHDIQPLPLELKIAK